MDSLTQTFNLSETLAWSTTRPTDPAAAFVGSIESGGTFLSAMVNWISKA